LQTEALAASQEGRSLYPEDTELLFHEALLCREQGDLRGAEALLLRLLQPRPSEHFASLDAGLSGYKARHNLAVVYQQQGRPADAETQWRMILEERPDFMPAWLGLAELRLRAADWPGLETLADQLAQRPGGVIEAAVLRARAHLTRKEYREAQ